jgi:outer membrane protein assembly factor BamE (lipoprotein component of BamABCDE complex)
MLRKITVAITLAATLALAGCAGTNFVRPDAAELRVGQSSYAQVIARMGQPRSTGQVLKNGETLKTITYAYAATGGEPLEAGVIPARAMSFFFRADTLVGQEFVSSFKADNTNFDESKVSKIEKGKSTRADVLALMGKPSGTYAKPMVKEPAGEAIGYNYVATSGSAFTGLKSFRKSLHVSFDANDIVSDVEFSSSGNR